MKTEWRRYAPLGLVIAGISAVVALALFIIYRNPRGLPFLISVGLTLIGLALYALLDPNQVRVVATGRQARYGSNALVRVLAFVGIVIVFNMLVYKLTGLYPDKTKVDLTEGKQNTLAPETVDTLAKLPAPVKAWGFYSPQSSSAQQNADVLLSRYAENSKGNFTYEFLDPDANPQAVKNANIPVGKDGVISLQMGEKRELVEVASEQNLTSGLVRLMSSEQRTIYFLTGHAEYNPDDTGDKSYSKVKTSLTNKNYIVKILNLRTDTAIPSDAKLIVVAGPTKPLMQDEVNMLATYVSQGGALMVLQDPPLQTDFAGAADPLADYLAATWGISYGNDFVVQVASNQPSPYITGVGLAAHPIVPDSLANNPPFFIAAQSIRVSENISATLTELVKSTPFYENCYPSCSWASQDPTSISQWLNGSASGPSNPTEQDLLGPITIVVSGESSATGARVVVYGDSDFAADSFYDSYGNSDLLVNSVDWAIGQEQLISLTPKDNTERSLNITPDNLAVVNNVLLLGLVIGLPGLVVLAGVLNWFLRRQRG
jgi:ABC-type uncharacterized transport system involved in gliding motility auxiliary subunit